MKRKDPAGFNVRLLTLIRQLFSLWNREVSVGWILTSWPLKDDTVWWPTLVITTLSDAMHFEHRKSCEMPQFDVRISSVRPDYIFLKSRRPAWWSNWNPIKVSRVLNQKLAAGSAVVTGAPALWAPQSGNQLEQLGNFRPGKLIVLGFMHHWKPLNWNDNKNRNEAPSPTFPLKSADNMGSTGWDKSKHFFTDPRWFFLQKLQQHKAV